MTQPLRRYPSAAEGTASLLPPAGGNWGTPRRARARISVRDAPGRLETEETPKLDVDLRGMFAEVSTTAGDRARRRKRSSSGS